MNKLPLSKRVAVVSALVEGNSLRSTCRMTGVAMNTVLKLLAELGPACTQYQAETLRGLHSRRIQCDEVWQFCYAKAKNVPADKQGQFGYGDVWTWIALDADTKLVPTWAIGGRDIPTATDFLKDLQSRLVNRVQLTTDGYQVYFDAVDDAFGSDVDYGQVVKIFGSLKDTATVRYSPSKMTGCRKEVIRGNPSYRHISTSFVERQNLTLRMNMRRFTRLTNAFSKKVENHGYALALHFMHYNFARIHKTLRVTPAMEASIATHVWSLEEIVGLLDRRIEAAA